MLLLYGTFTRGLTDLLRKEIVRPRTKNHLTGKWTQSEITRNNNSYELGKNIDTNCATLLLETRPSMDAKTLFSRPVSFFSASAATVVLLLCLHCVEGRKRAAYAFRGISPPPFGFEVGVTSHEVRAYGNVGMSCDAESK